MNVRVPIHVVLSVMMVGCATPSDRGRTRPATPPVQILPDHRLHGRIASVNSRGQFVVVDFNVGEIPSLPTRMNVYRNNDVVGVINLAGPVNDNLVAADIVRGEPAVGDEAILDPEESQGASPFHP